MVRRPAASAKCTPNITPDCVWDRRLRNLAVGPDQYRLPAKVDEVRYLHSVGALGHECIAGIVVPTGYCTAVSPMMNFHAVLTGTPELAR